jgi:glycosyltransferase involved in cell wall biosynthesis
LLLTIENATANNALLEGMACGLPVISEHIGGIPEYVRPTCAILTDPDDDEALARSVRRLAGSSACRQEMAAAARERACQLDWSKVARTMQKLYETLGR